MTALKRDGMADAVCDAVASGTPFFGVCLGLQLLLEHSEEGNVGCLGIVPGTVRGFSDAGIDEGLKVPHMGWNSVKFRGTHSVFKGIPEDSYFYFVHSYFADLTDDSWVEGSTAYGLDFTSVVAKGNVVATQFHPEKSGNIGLKLYDNFVKHLVLKRV